MTVYGYTSHRGTTRRASPDRRLATRLGSPTIPKRFSTKTRHEKPGVGVAMVGGLYQPGWNTRTRTGIHDSRLCVRVNQKTGGQARSGATSPAESGQDHSAFRRDVSRVCGTALHSNFSSHSETLNPQTLPSDLQRSFVTCLRQHAAVRDRSAGLAALCPSQNARRSWLGVLESFAQPHVEGVRRGENLELLRGGESGICSKVAGENTRAGETCFEPHADSGTTRQICGNPAERWHLLVC